MNQPHTPPRPTKKRQPRGLPILHEDQDILVVAKPAGLLTIGTDREKSRTAHYLLNDYVRKGDPKSRHRVYVVHRLDKDTSGILLFAKSEQAKQFLQEHWQETNKHYLAIVHGRLTPKEGTITSYLAENAAQKVYSTPDPAKGKLSQTAYKVLQESKGLKPGGDPSPHRPQAPDPGAFRGKWSSRGRGQEIRQRPPGVQTARSPCPLALLHPPIQRQGNAL